MRQLVLGILILWACGCAPSGQSLQTLQRQCRADADAAVGRGDWQAALRLHQQIVAQAPQNCLAIYHLGYILGKMGNRRAEVIQYERSLACGYDRDDRLLFNLGMAYGQLGRAREAVSALERAVALDGANADNHYGLGLMLQEGGRTDLAAGSYARALSADDRHREARLALCRILLDQGRLVDARQHLDVLAGQIPDDEQVRKLQRLYERRRAVLDEN